MARGRNGRRRKRYPDKGKPPKPKVREWSHGISQEGIDAYHERRSSLAVLGYSSYDAYLKSSLWKAIRWKVLKQHAKCHRCGKWALQVHHKSYSLEVMQGLVLDDLLAVCRSCHKRSEYTGTGQKLGPKEATAKLRPLKTRPKYPRPQ